MIRRFACCSGLFLAGALQLASFRTEAAIQVDGVLDEPEWQGAQVFGEFITTEPRTLEPARYRTEARVYTDESGIYIGFSNHQPADIQRVNRRFARDSQLDADRNVVGLDFDGTSLTGYDFTVSSSNSQQDGIFSREANYSGDWDGSWYSQTSSTADAWFSEIHIPWNVAPMSRAIDGRKTMRIYLSRVVYGESLRFAFPNASFYRPTFLSDWHPIEVEQIKTATLDFFPYLAYGRERVEGEDEWRAGIDVVWRPNGDLQFTGAINPDFGQVETDDLVVNFSAIETFFSEKRPFFTENQGLFRRDLPNGDLLVNTRRIGAASDAGDETRTDIDLAAKLTGQGDLLDYGVFAVTEDDTRLSEGGDYASTRLQGRIGDFAVGHSLTWADRGTLDRTALVNSVDLDWQPAAAFRVNGQLMQSRIKQRGNEFNGQRTQNDTDIGTYIGLRYAPDDRWQHTFNGYYYGDEFDINDLGFLQRNDHVVGQGIHRLEISDYGAGSSWRSSITEFDYGYEENTSGDKLLPWTGVHHQLVFDSTRELHGRIGLQAAGFDDLVSRGNGLVHLPQQQFYNLLYLSERGSRFTYDVELWVENDGTEKFSRQISVAPQYFITERVTVGGRALYRKYDEWLLWDFESRQMATYEAEQYEADLRLDWYPSTRQEIRVKFQWVGVGADARSGFTLSESGRLRPSAVPVSDFSVSDTAVQIRYRYELAPLSDIYLVYSRGGFYAADDSEAGPGRLFQQSWDNKYAETILAKIRYRF